MIVQHGGKWLREAESELEKVCLEEAFHTSLEHSYSISPHRTAQELQVVAALGAASIFRWIGSLLQLDSVLVQLIFICPLVGFYCSR